MYKVVRTEHMKVRPTWLVRVLLDVVPSNYGKVSSMDEAKFNLMAINNLILASHWLKKNTRLQHEGGSLKMMSKKNSPLISFNIINC